MNKSNTIIKLAVALANAQAEMPVVKMNAQNPFLKNKYADLGAVIETSRPVLAKHGLSISQFPTSEGDRIGVTSILMHSGGEWIEDSIFIPSTDAKGLSVAQSAGVVISYLRRYSWAAMLGLYADEDTDGHSSNGAKATTAKASATTTANPDPIDDNAWDKWLALCHRAEKVDVRYPLVNREKTTLSNLRDGYNELLQNVKSAEAQAKAG
jgi:hypothetical protein